MKTSRETTARNRAKILGIAGQLFRERGLDGVSVAEIMASAGLTHGGFYRYFASKEAMAAEACSLVAQQTETDWHTARDTDAEDGLAVLLSRYLTAEHRDSAATGCIYAALGCEVGRSSDDMLHQIFAEGLEGLLGILTEASPEPSATERRRAAIGRLSSLAGALMLARATKGTELSDQILAETRHWLESIQTPPPTP
ncbi:MAG: TetR/AcrR family transcriptional regulator [Oceanospirillales bacterium]|nr:TetR/AcrR family transcriptional regulator [Oceanospirillales bacterium]